MQSTGSHHHGCNLVLFVREPAVQVVEQRHEVGRPYWHALAHLVVEVDNSPSRLHLVNAHLAPSSPTIRLAEAETFALVARRGRNVIAMGDWNAAPAHDDGPLDGGSPRVRRKWDRRPAQAIEEVGFVDVGAYLGDGTPTVGHADGGPGYRCDRVYATLPRAAIVGYQVIDEEAPASDHRPVLARFALDAIDLAAAGTADRCGEGNR